MQQVAELKPSSINRSPEDIQTWIVAYLSDLMQVPTGSVDVNQQFDEFGLDSSVVVALSGDLEEWLGREIDVAILFDYPTIRLLSEHLGKS